MCNDILVREFFLTLSDKELNSIGLYRDEIYLISKEDLFIKIFNFIKEVIESIGCLRKIQNYQEDSSILFKVELLKNLLRNRDFYRYYYLNLSEFRFDLLWAFDYSVANMSVFNSTFKVDDLSKLVFTGKTCDWINYLHTNCYAYALGLDIMESLIVNKAYQPGIISLFDKNKVIEEVPPVSFERIENDFNALSLNFEVLTNMNSITNLNPNNRVIAFMQSANDFHFAYMDSEGWSHKESYTSCPNYIDFDSLCSDYDVKRLYLVNKNKEIYKNN